MAVPVTIYLLFNLGSSSAWGWGIAMSTDTAFALGLLALVGPRFPDRLRAFFGELATEEALGTSRVWIPDGLWEPRAAAAEYDKGTGNYTLWSTSQNPHVLRLILSAFVLGIPEHKLRVIAPEEWAALAG